MASSFVIWVSLEKGHLVETDRAGLVAGYVGLNSPQNRKARIAEALDWRALH